MDAKRGALLILLRIPLCLDPRSIRPANPRATYPSGRPLVSVRLHRGSSRAATLPIPSRAPIRNVLPRRLRQTLTGSSMHSQRAAALQLVPRFGAELQADFKSPGCLVSFCVLRINHNFPRTRCFSCPTSEPNASKTSPGRESRWRKRWNSLDAADTTGSSTYKPPVCAVSRVIETAVDFREDPPSTAKHSGLPRGFVPT